MIFFTKFNNFVKMFRQIKLSHALRASRPSFQRRQISLDDLGPISGILKSPNVMKLGKELSSSMQKGVPIEDIVKSMKEKHPEEIGELMKGIKLSTELKVKVN